MDYEIHSTSSENISKNKGRIWYTVNVQFNFDQLWLITVIISIDSNRTESYPTN